jgi:hypothetical protein
MEINIIYFFLISLLSFQIHSSLNRFGSRSILIVSGIYGFVGLKSFLRQLNLSDLDDVHTGSYCESCDNHQLQ